MTSMAFQLALLFLFCFSSYACNGAKLFPPPPPSRLPSRNKTINIAVEGVIYCKSCKLPGYVMSVGGAPLPGVLVKVLCIKGNYVRKASGRTDAHGYFIVPLSKVVTTVITSCKVFPSPPKSCKKPVIPAGINLKAAGAPVRFERFDKEGSTITALVTSGFFLFAPATPPVCPRLT